MKTIKKIAIMVVLMASVCMSSFATGKMGALTFSLPYDKLTSKYNDGTKIGMDYSWFGLGVVNMSNSMYSSVDVGFLTKMKNSSSDHWLKKSDMDSDATVIYMNVLAGIGIPVVDNGALSVVIAPGIHYALNYQKYGSTNVHDYMTFGLGADAILNYFFGSSFFATAGVGFAYDFFGVYIGTNHSTEKAKYSNLTFVPKIGIGMRY